MSVTSPQKTIAADVSLSGRGLFTGVETTLTFKPAPVGHGIVFVRTDLSRPVRIPALVQHVTKRSRRTAIKTGADSVETIEHCMAALAGTGVTNAVVRISGGITGELPAGDGSSQPFVDALQQGGSWADNVDPAGGPQLGQTGGGHVEGQGVRRHQGAALAESL